MSSASSSPAEEGRSKTVGVLAIQGSFAEHLEMLAALGTRTREVRLPEDLEGLDGLILPGGESTTMAIIGEPTGVFPALRSYIQSGKPVWGTCAGLILLSNTALFQKEGGQALVGGLDIEVCRNFFGSQVESCEMDMEVGVLEDFSAGMDDKGHRAVFIRAPAILQVAEGVDVLARVKAKPCSTALASMQASNSVPDEFKPAVKKRKTSSDLSAAQEFGLGVAVDTEPWDVIVAVQKGTILGTAFHPEFTSDQRWHKHFLSMVNTAASSAES
uniref:glutaminase n=1 Tax=Rhizochromulina marina TaxID=1034831 RepID=A0A7S2RJG7_9STRA